MRSNTELRWWIDFVFIFFFWAMYVCTGLLCTYVYVYVTMYVGGGEAGGFS